MDYSLVGPLLVLIISSIGSAFGCYIAGAASHAGMSRVEEGHGALIGMSAAPATITIYGFILMLMMNKAIAAGTMLPIAGVAMGLLAGGALMITAVLLGKVCATGIQATIKQPAISGKCFAAIGIIESIALFIFVFSILLL